MEEYRIYPTATMLSTKYDCLFLKGPVPYPWIRSASKIGGKTLHVGVLLWMISGMQKNKTFKLQLKFFEDCGISRTTLYSSLHKLQEENLIQLLKTRGKTHTVKICL